MSASRTSSWPALLRLDPFIAGLLAALTLGFFFPARGETAAVLEAAAKVGIALLFFFHGAKLSREAVIAGIGHWRLHLLVLGASFGLFPALGWLTTLAPAALLSPAIATGFLYLSLLPSTVQSSIAFTSIARGNVPAAICSASLSNLLGIFLTPLLVGLLIHFHGGGFSWSAIEAIVLQLLAPFIAGHLMRPLIGGWVSRHARLVSFTDRGSIVLVVYNAFAASTVAGLWDRVAPRDLIAIALISVVMLVLMLVATTYAARLFGFSRADEIAIVFCGSKKSLASGVPMAAALFPAASLGAMILPLMVFHQIQLSACAFLARRYSEQPEPPARAAEIST